MEANQGLAEQRQPFQAGLLIMFPDMPAITPDAEHITLWD
ncbi:UNVERIFIED_ORG: phage tail protein X [Pseudomonas cremoricolorata]|nr:phage tail protein X [Pseudomonas cremoricolorata]